eukprot:3242855-Rhodomonas_salina.1
MGGMGGMGMMGGMGGMGGMGMMGMIGEIESSGHDGSSTTWHSSLSPSSSQSCLRPASARLPAPVSWISDPSNCLNLQLLQAAVSEGRRGV